MTALHFATLRKNYWSVKLLLINNVDLNAKSNSDNWTQLCLGVSKVSQIVVIFSINMVIAKIA